MHRTEKDTAIVICQEDGTTLDLDEFLLEHGVEQTMGLLGIQGNATLEETLARYLEVIREVMKSETRLLACEREVEEQIARLSKEQFEELLSSLDHETQDEAANELTEIFRQSHPDEDAFEDPLEGIDETGDFHLLH